MSGYFYLQTQLRSQFVLTIDGFTVSGLLAMYPIYGGANQLWKFGPNDTLVSKMGLVADVKDGSTVPKTNCIGYFPTGADNQKWSYENGQIISKLNDLVIDITDADTTVSTPVQMWQNTGEPQQKWTLVPESELAEK